MSSHPRQVRPPVRWRWIPVIVAVVVVGILVFFGIARGDARRAECLRLYQAARNASDTLSVDGTVPLAAASRVTDMSMTCGVRRRLGKLQ